MACISMPTALLGSSLLSGAGSLVGGMMQSGAATDAASIQANAAIQAAQLQKQQYNSNKRLLNPFIGAGTNALTQLQQLTGTNKGGDPLTAALTAKFQPTMAQLEQTPGYQFTKQQGLDAAQNSAAAQGLGASGAAVKGAINYAEGLAGTTYQQQFQNYLGQNQQIYNMISGQANMGLGAAQSLAGMGTQSALAQGNFLTSGAAATAGGVMGSTNALAGGLSGLTSGLGSGAALYGLSGGFTGNRLASGSGDLSPAQIQSMSLAAGLKMNADGSIS